MHTIPMIVMAYLMAGCETKAEAFHDRASIAWVWCIFSIGNFDLRKILRMSNQRKYYQKTIDQVW